jgi:hypothetical protein
MLNNIDKNTTPTIIWEKWIDPFGENIDEAKWGDYDEEDNDLSFQSELKEQLQKPIKVISSPLGIIPYNEHSASSKIFNFWVGHTNFNLSNKVCDTIEKIEGVEILDVFTRYRFRIAIGKAFKDNEVLNTIKLSINSLFNMPIYHNDAE